MFWCLADVSVLYRRALNNLIIHEIHRGEGILDMWTDIKPKSVKTADINKSAVCYL